MSEPEIQKAGAEHRAEVDTKGLTTHELQSTPGPEVFLVDSRCAAIESPGAAVGLAGPEVIVVSAGEPISELTGKRQWFEPFEIRPSKSVLEIAVRVIQGTFALFLSLMALAYVIAIGVRLSWQGNLDFQPGAVFWSIPLVIAFLAMVMDYVAARRFVYWRVDQAGIHQYWFGLRNWRLSWSEIVSRTLGPQSSPAWLFLYFVPVAGGPYQPIVLEDRQGRKRRVNRLAQNGDRVDAMIRQHLDFAGEAHAARTYWNAIESASAIHSRQDPARVPLHLLTKDSPVVRMKMHEPRLLPVCCNCLGPRAVTVPISTSPGPIGFFNDNFLRLMIPLCSACQARTRRSRSALFARVAIALVLGSIAIIAFSSAALEPATPWRVFFLVLGVCFCAPLLAMLWNEMSRPTPTKLVKVVRASSGGDWMEVRFGNPDYARLVDELNGNLPAK
jgi:hypothetical protein